MRDSYDYQLQQTASIPLVKGIASLTTPFPALLTNLCNRIKCKGPFHRSQTFLRMSRKKDGENIEIYQPFFPREEGQCEAVSNVERNMKIGMNDLEIEEIAMKEGLSIICYS